MTVACLSEVSLKDTAWAFRRFLCRKILDLGGQDLAGGRGGGRNNPPSRFSFLVENVSGSSWNSGRGRHVLEVTFGGGLTGVCRMCGVDEDRGNDFCGGVCGSTTDSPLNIITTCNLLNVKYNHNMNYILQV